jgi:hypothetical protein
MADLTTLPRVKEWLSVTTATNDALLARLISAASDYIETYLSRNISLTAYQSYRDGTGGRRLMFRNYPVVSLVKLSIDGQDIPPSVKGAPGYVFTETSVSLVGGYVFTQGASNVYLEYSAGYNPIPNEIEQACIDLVALRYRERDHVGITSKSLAGESVAYSTREFSDAVGSTLVQYKRVALP